MAISWGGIASERLGRLERSQRQRAGTVQNADNYQFTISPTCPPSTSIVFRGGLSWYPAWVVYPAGYYIPGYTIDLTDSDKVSVRPNYTGYTYTFTNPYWYAPCVVIIYVAWPPPVPPATWPTEPPDSSLYLYGGIAAPYFQEFETAAEAEDACRMIRGDTASAYGIVAGSLILRNDGNTTDPNQYQPVDRVNRGRSYLFGGKRYGWEMG